MCGIHAIITSVARADSGGICEELIGHLKDVNSRRGPDFSLPCLHCGELGHWKATCPTPPNPSKVQAAKNRMHAKQAPLNGR